MFGAQEQVQVSCEQCLGTGYGADQAVELLRHVVSRYQERSITLPPDLRRQLTDAILERGRTKHPNAENDFAYLLSTFQREPQFEELFDRLLTTNARAAAEAAVSLAAQGNVPAIKKLAERQDHRWVAALTRNLKAASSDSTPRWLDIAKQLPRKGAADAIVQMLSEAKPGEKWPGSICRAIEVLGEIADEKNGPAVHAIVGALRFDPDGTKLHADIGEALQRLKAKPIDSLLKALADKKATSLREAMAHTQREGAITALSFVGDERAVAPLLNAAAAEKDLARKALAAVESILKRVADRVDPVELKRIAALETVTGVSVDVERIGDWDAPIYSDAALDVSRLADLARQALGRRQG